MKPKTIKIDDQEYVPAGSVFVAGPTKIAILQRGWVVVGTFAQDGERMTLTDASVIRQWGTSKGLGELALNGPTSTTVLDPCGTVTFHELTVVALLDCQDGKW